MFENEIEQEASMKDGTSSHQRKSVHSSKRMIELPDRTLRCRHEMKYHISESKAQAIIQFIKPYIQVDRYCKLQRSGDYPIVSLYLDSSDLQLCKESLRGHKNRFKLRVRSYTDEPEYPRFLEIKRRMNTIIIKSRARVLDRDIPTLFEGLPLPPQNYTADIDTINQFQLYMNSIKAKPMVLIRYMRQAFEGDSLNKVRVTFDRQLSYCITTLPEVRLSGSGWHPNPFTEGGVVLEIKFTDHYPAWLDELVKSFNLRLRSISKYASSIEESCELRYCAPQMDEY